MLLFFMRHGRTKLTGTFCGSLNPPLNRRGKADIQAAARALSKYPVDLCYFSPQRRAKETATMVCRRLRHVHQISEPLLKEIDFGAWEGLRFSDVETKWPSLAQAWAKDPMKVRIPGAESFPSLRRRVRRFLKKAKKLLHSQNVLIVAHGGTLAAIMMELLKRPNREYPEHIQPPGSVRKMDGRTLRWVYRPC